MKRSHFPVTMLASTLILVACTIGLSKEAQAHPRTLTLKVGAGKGTVAINAFFPETIHILPGDTLTWKLDSNEVHTVSFFPAAEPLVAQEVLPVPGGGPTDSMLHPQIGFPTRFPGSPVETFSGKGLVSSGLMSKEVLGPPGTPPNDTFTVTFDKPGTYEYVCLIHPYAMRATVIVDEAPTPDLPQQAQIDAQAKKELTPLMAQIEAIKEAGKTARNEPGPNGTTIWHVQAGGISRDPGVELLEFLPKVLTIKKGDTVIWTSPSFHQVTFHPGRPHPEFVVPKPQEQGPPLLTMNPEVVFPLKPSGEFDGTGFWSSGLMFPPSIVSLPGGPGIQGPWPGGSTFAMTFSTAGTFEYMCAVHQELGEEDMEGTIIVTE